MPEDNFRQRKLFLKNVLLESHLIKKLLLFCIFNCSCCDSTCGHRRCGAKDVNVTLSPLVSFGKVYVVGDMIGKFVMCPDS